MIKSNQRIRDFCTTLLIGDFRSRELHFQDKTQQDLGSKASFPTSYFTDCNVDDWKCNQSPQNTNESYFYNIL